MKDVTAAFIAVVAALAVVVSSAVVAATAWGPLEPQHTMGLNATAIFLVVLAIIFAIDLRKPR